MITKYICVAAYFIVLLAIGFFASRRVSGLNDFLIGGKRLGYWVAAFSAQATGESAWLLLGLTGMGAMVGVSAYWVVVGEVIGVAIAWFVMARPFKKQTDEYNSITIPGYLESRFKAKTRLLRGIAAFALSIFIIIYISAQIDATGAAFESFLGWNYFLGAIIGFAVIVAYCIAGGFLAVCWTDMFQGAVMLVALAALPIVAFIGIENSSEIATGLASIDSSLLNIWGDGGFSLLNLMSVLGMALIGLGFLGSPQVFARFMSIKDESEIKKGRWVAVFFTIIVGFSAVSIGILGRYIFTTNGQDPEAILGRSGQDVLPILVDGTFPPIIVGVYVAAVLSAIMSTISSLLILASASVTQDFYHRIMRPDLSQKVLAGLGRKVTLVIAIFALTVAMLVAIYSPDRTIFWFVIFGWSGIAATFCPMIILALFWNKFNESGAIAAMIVGFVSIPFFKFIGPELPYIGEYITRVEALPPSFALSLFVGYFVTILTSLKLPRENELVLRTSG